MPLPLLLGLISAVVVLVMWAGLAWGWPFILIGLIAFRMMRRPRREYRTR